MKNIIYFFRGVWRELVCLKNKVVHHVWPSFSWKQRCAIAWSLLGAMIGMGFAGMAIARDIEFFGRAYPQALNADYWAMCVMMVMGTAIMGVFFIWVIPTFLYMIFIFMKHTINVGRS